MPLLFTACKFVLLNKTLIKKMKVWYFLSFNSVFATGLILSHLFYTVTSHTLHSLCNLTLVVKY